MNLLERLSADYSEFGISKELRVDEVNQLGYLVSGESLPLGQPALFELFKLTDENGKKRSLEFCYLFHIKSGTGFIMPRPYEEYLALVPKPEKNHTGGKRI